MPDQTAPYLTIFGFEKPKNEYGWSPFVMKLHFRLRYGGLVYTVREGTKASAPKGKVPYVKFTETGDVMGDSALIIQRLEELGKLDDVTAGLDEQTRAMDYCLTSMIEDRMYWYLVSI